MTVQTNTNVASFNGNGVTQIFPIAFKFNNDTDLIVMLADDATGSSSLLTLNSDYTVSGEGDEEGGLINVVVAPAVGKRLFVSRVVDILQMTDLRNQGKFFAEVHEDAFDLLTMIAQQHQSDIARSLRVAETDPEPARIPSAVQRAGKLLAFDSAGNPTTTLPIADSSTELRQELAAPAGASKIGYGGRTLDQWLDENRSILDYGAVADGVADDSAAASAMLAELNRLVIPSGRTVVLKNIELQAGASVEIRGCAKLPSACVDFDRMFYATGKGGITIDAKEIDGNAAGQSGFIGTHLLYMLDCNDLQVSVRHIHDHYAPAGGAFATDDGVRDSSTGCVLIYRSTRAVVSVGLLDKWGREGIQLRECVRSTVSLGHAQGYDGGDEYSGLQVSGENNSVLRASVDNAGASGVGFDTKNGALANVITTRSRENHGVNFGHTGFPATGSVATNLLVDGAFRNGISVGASTEDLTIDGFSVRNAGEYGINYSDSAARGKLANGVVDTCGQFNLSAYQTQVEARNVRYAALDALSVQVDAVTGTFATGETVSSSGASAVVRKVLKNRAGDKQILFLNSVSGTFVANNTISGGTSLASGTIGLVNTPAAKRESTGGVFIEESSLTTGGLGTTTKLSDGTMIHRHGVAVDATASTLATLATNYPSSAAWVEAPHVTATVIGASSTDAFNLERLSCTRTATAFTVKLKASVAQTYSIDVISIGRWK